MLALLAVVMLGGSGVEVMSLDELLVEDVRLELKPSLAPPATMVGLGAVAAVASFAAMGFAIYDLTALSRMPPIVTDGFRPNTLPSINETFACIHGVFAAVTVIAGMMWLTPRRQAAEVAEADRLRVRARLTKLEASGAQHDRVGVALKQLALLEAATPNNTLPGALLASGLVATIVGVVSLSFVNNSASAISGGVAELAVGGALFIAGTWLLQQRHHEREALEARKERLRALLSDVEQAPASETL